jgi:hypothetical protein
LQGNSLDRDLVTIRSVLKECNRPLLHCITTDSKSIYEGGDGIGLIPNFLRPAIAHYGGIVATQLLCREGLWSLRAEGETMSQMIRAGPVRELRLYDKILNIMNDESNHEYGLNDELLLSDYRAKSEDRRIVQEILETFNHVSVTKQSDSFNGTFTIKELRQHRQRSEMEISDFLNKYKSVYADQFSCVDDDQCNKKVPKNPNNTAGIFIICCGKKGCCRRVLGMKVMDTGESPKFFYDFIRERLPVKPKYVLYDAACKLKSYAMARDSKFFCHITILFDRLHESNHVWSCNPSHFLKLYNAHELLGGCVSQVCEQVNSEIKRYPVHTVRHMNLAHAMIYMSTFFVLLNERNSLNYGYR